MRHYCSAITLSVPSSFLLICTKGVPQTPLYSLGSLLYFNLFGGKACAYFCLDISRQSQIIKVLWLHWLQCCVVSLYKLSIQQSMCSAARKSHQKSFQLSSSAFSIIFSPFVHMVLCLRNKTPSLSVGIRAKILYNVLILVTKIGQSQ